MASRDIRRHPKKKRIGKSLMWAAYELQRPIRSLRMTQKKVYLKTIVLCPTPGPVNQTTFEHI